MNKTPFESFGDLAEATSDYLAATARYRHQDPAKKKIYLDLIQTLGLSSDDVVLEIGCGVGELLVPLSYFVKTITGIDHPGCIKRLEERIVNVQNASSVKGNFLNVPIFNKFNKILCYSVLQYLQDEKEVFEFIDKALSLLRPKGRALFGDLPNASLKKRFLESETGKELDKQWRESIASSKNEINLNINENTVQFNDQLILNILKKYREEGYDAYVLSQPKDLPFGNTREDILIIKRD